MVTASPARLRRAVALLAALLALAVLLPLRGSQAQVGQASRAFPEGEIQPGVVLVRFKPDVQPSRAAGALAAQGALEEGEIRPIRVRKLRVPRGREREIAARLQSNPDVDFAEPSYLVRALWEPDNDPLYPADGLAPPGQWNLRKINMPQAWDHTRGAPGVKVAVIDTGIDTAHPDRPANLQLGWDYVDGDPVPNDEHGHGTHVAGIVAARTNNGVGVAGVAPDVTLLAIRVLNRDGAGSHYAVASAIIEAADAAARVVNLSLGSPQESSALRAAVDYANGKGVLIAAAAGNCYDVPCPLGFPANSPLYPAAYPGVLAVAATTPDDDRATYSNTGSHIGIAAPGSSVLSTCAGSYYWLSGTSMATPHVAGLAALMLSSRPYLSADRVASMIKDTADPVGQSVPNDEIGHGRIDAVAALQATEALPIYRVYLPLVARN